MFRYDKFRFFLCLFSLPCFFRHFRLVPFDIRSLADVVNISGCENSRGKLDMRNMCVWRIRRFHRWRNLHGRDELVYGVLI